MRLIIIAMLIALIALPVMAEIKNLKVTGHLRFRGYAINNADKSDANNDHIDYYVQRTWLGVEGDVTDNIYAKIILENEFVWGKTGAPNDDAANNSINFVYAYATLKNLLGQPLSLTVGRQPYNLGNGFILWDAADGYDGMKLTYSGSNFALDVLNLKTNDGIGAAAAEVDFYGIVGAYKGIEKNTLTAYCLINDDNSDTTTNDIKRFIGLRAEGSIPSIDALSYIAEYIKQGGKVEKAAGVEKTDYDASLLYLQAGYLMKDFYKTTIMVEYLNTSGQDDADTDDITAFYAPLQSIMVPGGANFDPGYGDALRTVGYTYTPNFNKGLKSIAIAISSSPTEKLTVGGKYYMLKSDEDYDDGKNKLGNSFDLYAKYNLAKGTNVCAVYSQFNPSSDLGANLDNTTYGGLELRIDF